MSANVRVEGIPAVKKMLAPFADARQLSNTLRRAVRAGAQPMRAALQSAARSEPTGPLPDSFQKVKAPKVSTRGGATGRDIQASVRPDAALFAVFESGADTHEIAGALLAGPAGQKGRSQPMTARGRVRHPGMTARPILPTAYAAGKAEALEKTAAVIFGHAAGGSL